MKNKLWRACLSSPLFVAALMAQTEVSAQTVKSYSEGLNQITNVNQLRDVSPTDWAYEALRSLVDRYGCISGFPNQAYRGSQPLSRYEFAAGLNSCLNQIERLIATSETDAVSSEDLATVNRLSQEFEAELARIGGRVDGIESRTAVLEDSQFSTTTKLGGETSFALSQVFGDEKADGSGELDSETVFNFRSRLSFNTSFTGKDLLKVRLDALNTVPFGSGEEEDDPNVTGTGMTRTAFDEGSDGSVRIGKLYYTFAIGESGKSDHSGHGHDDHGHDSHGHDGEKESHGGHSEHLHGAAEGKLSFVIDAVGGEFNENFANYNEYFSEELTGAVSRFGRFNPIYYQGLEGTGATVNYSFSNAISLSVGYLSPRASEPLEGAGLFNGSYAAIAQASIQPTDSLGFGLTYSRGYYAPDELVVSGETGSENANAPFGEEIATSADHFGLQGKFEISDRLSISAWGGLSLAHAQGDGDNEEAGVIVSDGDSATIFNWAVTLAFPDLLSEGSLGGIIFGQPPKVSSNDGGEEDADSAWHIEAQYRYQLNDHVAINHCKESRINCSD
ncbi:MAG: iron uptake porin [Cyanobacteria bacterium J06600_6]